MQVYFQTGSVSAVATLSASDIILRSGETNPNDVRLYDPTAVPTGGIVTTLTADTVAFVLAGKVAVLLARLSGGLGTFTETGIAARLTVKLVVSAGAYVDTGNAAALKAVLSGSPGAYSETGRSATLTAVLRPIRGTYVLTGYAVTNPPGGEERQFLMLLGVR